METTASEPMIPVAPHIRVSAHMKGTCQNMLLDMEENLHKHKDPELCCTRCPGDKNH